MFHSFTPETDKSAYSGGGRLTLPLCIDVGCWNIYMYAKRTSRFMRFFFLLLEYTCTFMHYAVDVGSCSVRRMLNWRLPDENSPESLFFFLIADLVFLVFVSLRVKMCEIFIGFVVCLSPGWNFVSAFWHSKREHQRVPGSVLPCGSPSFTYCISMPGNCCCSKEWIKKNKKRIKKPQNRNCDDSFKWAETWTPPCTQRENSH